MYQSLPGDTVVATRDGLPANQTGTIGLSVIRASNGTVIQGFTTTGVVERPTGSGSYVATFVAPIEGDTYIGVIADADISPTVQRTFELRVAATIPVEPSGLGVIADDAKSHLGGLTFDGLLNDEHYGTSYILGRIEVVKERVMTSPPATADEGDLPRLVRDYLGKLVALELMPAAFDWHAGQLQSQSTGNDPSEITSYPNRLEMLKAIQNTLLAQTRKDEAVVLPLLATPRLRSAFDDGPAIDEADDCRVTEDPRDFPRRENFPSRGLPRTGVRL